MLGWRVPSAVATETRSLRCSGFQPNDIVAYAFAKTSFNPIRSLIYPKRIDFSYLFKSETFANAAVVPTDGQYYITADPPFAETEILPGVPDTDEFDQYCCVEPDNALLTLPFTVSESTYAVIVVGITANYVASGTPPHAFISVPPDPENPQLYVRVYREEPDRHLVIVGEILIGLPEWSSMLPYTQYQHFRVTVPLIAGRKHILTLHHAARVRWANSRGGIYTSLSGGGGMGVSLAFILNRTTIPIVPAEAFYADVNGDGAVDDSDLLIILSSIGQQCQPQPCVEDINGDGVVDDADLLVILSNIGLEY
ncbi:MAG: hypothetical protein QW683_08570 [Candidatus Caldarchaeum sp.]